MFVYYYVLERKYNHYRCDSDAKYFHDDVVIVQDSFIVVKLYIHKKNAYHLNVKTFLLFMQSYYGCYTCDHIMGGKCDDMTNRAATRVQIFFLSNQSLIWDFFD